MSPKVRVTVSWVAASGCFAFVWVLSSLSPSELPDITGRIWDKAGHLSAFFVVGLVLCNAVRTSWPDCAGARALAVAAIGAAAWGLLDEMHQAFVPGRSPDLLDFIADAIGSALGSGVRVILPLTGKRAGAYE